ncbi:hypothetical protein M378DRAFT_84910 [Amanita muscaria Koide BX008]|uniref:Uncharacterized protein n=1 Tax=Amanita muscaria (strain Koide BX008) TaxID=946122 RepID=A0A0C2WS63_AMAMK|nr:hypothetical protein M378DRAFT_84910 [Amanita muscaria Koide BX008]
MQNAVNIRSRTKLRRLKQYAVNSNISGLVKTGKPGVLVFDGTRESIKTFLENARMVKFCVQGVDLGLGPVSRYLDFHHVDTSPLPRFVVLRLN